LISFSTNWPECDDFHGIDIRGFKSLTAAWFGDAMSLYEIINPFDCVTFEAPDDATAVAVVLALGEGKYGARRCEDEQDVGGFLLFATNYEVGLRLTQWLGTDFETFANEHKAELAEALIDCATVKPEARDKYEEACRRQDTIEDLLEYQAQVEDRNRSSINDIVGRAWVLGRALRRRA